MTSKAAEPQKVLSSQREHTKADCCHRVTSSTGSQLTPQRNKHRGEEHEGHCRCTSHNDEGTA